MLPKEEKIAIATKKELLDSITGLLGGRVAEDMFLNEITTGASDDFKKATNIARSMVTEYGMSDLGPMQLEQRSENVFLGRDYTSHKNFSDQVALEIDQEGRKIIDECYKKAVKIISENKDLINLLADALMVRETLTREQIIKIVETGKNDEETINTELTLKEKAKALKIKGYTKMSDEELEQAIKEKEVKDK